MAAPVPTGTVDFMTSAWRSEAGISADHRVDRGQVGVAGVGRRRAHGHEQQPGVLERLDELGGEMQPLAVAGHALGQPGLVDRDLAPLEPLHLLGVDVHAPHVAAELGKAGRGDQADVAGADDGDGFAFGAHRAEEGSGLDAPTGAASTPPGQRRAYRASEAAMADHLRLGMSLVSVLEIQYTARAVRQATLVSLPPARTAAAACRPRPCVSSGLGEQRRVLPGRALHPVVLAEHRVEHERHPVGGVRVTAADRAAVGARVGAGAGASRAGRVLVRLEQ